MAQVNPGGGPEESNPRVSHAAWSRHSDPGPSLTLGFVFFFFFASKKTETKHIQNSD